MSEQIIVELPDGAKVHFGRAKRPDKVEMEFGCSLSGNCDLRVVSGEGKADFKVKLTWSKGE